AVEDNYFEELFHLYKSTLEKTNLHWIIFGHSGENHFHPNIMARNKEEYEQGHRIFKDWAVAVSKMGGTITAEHGAGKIKRELAL
ncbi:MAG: FAD-linked oxidase C-terminal domain-containing protein, partial [Clostridiales bacterium]